MDTLILEIKQQLSETWETQLRTFVATTATTTLSQPQLTFMLATPPPKPVIKQEPCATENLPLGTLFSKQLFTRWCIYVCVATSKVSSNPDNTSFQDYHCFGANHPSTTVCDCGSLFFYYYCFCFCFNGRPTGTVIPCKPEWSPSFEA